VHAVPRASPSPPSPISRDGFYLLPGQVAAFAAPTAITTVLGSCVAVCVWAPRQAVGGMNHFMLPHWTGPEEFSPRFAHVAVAQLLDRMSRLGCEPTELEARLLGGARLLPAASAAGFHLGERNSAVARRLLSEAGIPITLADTGGGKARRIVFHTDTGTVQVQTL
jgi:chemotaxis protein CheD